MAIRKRKCENCGTEISIKSEREHPTGWVRTGRSRHGREYDRPGIAWWCPDCEDAKDAINLPAPVIEALKLEVREERLNKKYLAFQIANGLLNRGMIIDNINASALEMEILKILENGG